MEEQVDLKKPLMRTEEEVISFFCDGVRLLGLPKSIGEIYGLFYISKEPLSLDDLIEKLEISKGSASQGLKFLRNLGAVKQSESDDRKAHYIPVLNLKQLVAGFIREEVVPHLKSGESKLGNLKKVVTKDIDIHDREFYDDRIDQLGRWSKQAKILLPLLQKVLGN